MSKLPRVNARQILVALRRAGFEERRQTGSHIILRHPETKRMAVVPFHSGALSIGLINSILDQAGLTPDEFMSLLE